MQVDEARAAINRRNDQMVLVKFSSMDHRRGFERVLKNAGADDRTLNR